MNFFVPLLLGSVDMAKGIRYKINYLYSKVIYHIKNKNDRNYLTITNNNQVNNNILENNNENSFGSYLGGLFEGDGHI